MTTLLAPLGAPVEGVMIDLDDTLYPQHEWLEGACAAVAKAAGANGVDEEAMLGALETVLAAGSDTGETIDRALSLLGSAQPVEPLLKAFRAHRPAHLEPFPGAEVALARLAELVPMVVVSDGDPDGQRAKLYATGLAPLFKGVVLSDELGRRHRKPDPLPFLRALEMLGLPASAVVMVGDRPEKDVGGAAAVGMRAIRVLTGEYAHMADHPCTWAVSPSLADAAAFLADLACPVDGGPEATALPSGASSDKEGTK